MEFKITRESGTKPYAEVLRSRGTAPIARIVWDFVTEQYVFVAYSGDFEYNPRLELSDVEKGEIRKEIRKFEEEQLKPQPK
jgi:hypothetical protein